MVLITRSHIEPIEPSLIPAFVPQPVITQYFLVPTLSVLVYDTVITLDKEARYFWKKPRRPVDFVYFVNRYGGIFGATSLLYWNSFSETLPMCNFAQWAYSIASWITIISIDYVLMIRVLALYSQGRLDYLGDTVRHACRWTDIKLALFLKTLLILEAASKLGLLIYMVLFEHVALAGFADIVFCVSDNIIPWQLGMVDWLIPIVYGMILMTLALYKAAEYWRMSHGFKGFSLVKVLVQDQVMYYALIIGCSMFGVLQFKSKASNLFLSNVLGCLGSPSFLCVLGSRMLFNMKEMGEQDQNEGTSYRTPSSTMSDIEFVESANPRRESATESGGREENP